MSEILCKTCGKPLNQCSCQKGLTATVIVTGKSEIEKLDAENKDLKEKLSQIAEKAFEKEKDRIAEKLNLSQEEKDTILEGSDLDRYRGRIEERERKEGLEHHTASGKATWENEERALGKLHGFNYGTVKRNEKGKIEGWQEGEFETQEQLIEVLKEISDNEKNQYPQEESNEAKRVLNLLIKKSLESEQKEPTSMVYEGSLSDVLKGHYNPKLWKKPSAKELQEGEN